MWAENLENGKTKFVERYTDYLTGKQKKVSVTMDRDTAQTRKAAQKTLNLKIEKLCSQHKTEELTLRSLADQYIAFQMANVKKSTSKRNEFAITAFLRILGKDTLVERLTAGYVRSKFAASGKPKSTLDEYLKRFKAMVRWGYQNEKVKDVSFLDKIKKFESVSPRQKIQDKFLESFELSELLEGMLEERWALLTKFLALSGLRFGEFSALPSDCVDMGALNIHVGYTYDSINKITTPPKTDESIRDIHIQPELYDVCKQIKVYALRQRLMHGDPPSDLFLPDIGGKNISYYTFYKYLKETSERVLGRRITPHVLRHTHASLLAENGADYELIARRLGHADSKITKAIYIHVTKRMKERDDNFLDKTNLM
ncbi:MAG: site-specific integrase [Lachnospiraceae bacterium]|nr:site-specific integrase [Lachnospiraceae bacterium]